jgi:hypothetical protein
MEGRPTVPGGELDTSGRKNGSELGSYAADDDVGFMEIDG